MGYTIWKFNGMNLYTRGLYEFRDIFHIDFYSNILVVANNEKNAINKVMKALKFACEVNFMIDYFNQYKEEIYEAVCETIEDRTDVVICASMSSSMENMGNEI
jgi:hypothetical protein